MADFTSLKQTIQSYVKQNGNEEITGNILQDVLLAMVTTMGDGAINSLASALQDEITARQNQDGTLQGNITAEARARQQADTALGGRIDGLQTVINGINTKLAEGYIFAGIATPSTNPETPSGKVFYIAIQAGTYTNFSDVSVTEGITILKNNGTTWNKELVLGIDDEPTDGSSNTVKSGGVYSLLSYFSKSLSIEATYNNGYYINASGYKIVMNAYKYSNPISCSAGSVIKVTTLGAANNVAIISSCDSMGENITPIVIADTSEVKTYTLYIEKDSYIIVCGLKNTFNLKVLFSDAIHSIEDRQNNSIMKILSQRINYKDGIFINNVGQEISNIAFTATDFVIADNKLIYMFNCISSSDRALCICFYDSNKTFISRIIQSSLGVDKIVSCNIPEGASYFRVSFRKDRKDEFLLWTSTSNAETDSFCNYNGSEITMFNKGICIGDSLTIGTMNYKEDGITKYINIEKYSYPTQLHKMTNIEISNLGIGGYTSWQWYNYYAESDLSGYDFAIIQLGVNDTGKNMTAYGKAWSTQEDSGNQNNSYNGFSNIINKLKNENTNIKIYVSTIIPAMSYASEDYIAFCQSLRNFIASLNDANVILLDMQVYGNTKNEDAYNCGHLSAYGYWRLALDYKGIISYHIHKNPEQYKQVQFIGTDYIYS